MRIWKNVSSRSIRSATMLLESSRTGWEEERRGRMERMRKDSLQVFLD